MATMSRGPARRETRFLPTWLRHLIALLAVAVLVALLWLINPFVPLGRYPMAYIVLVMLCTYLLGEGPGILALVLGWLAFSKLFLPPGRLWPLANTPDGWAAQVSFILGTLIVLLAAAFVRRTRRHIERLVAELTKEVQDRKQAEESARASEARLQATLQSIADEVWIVDTEGRFVLVSDSVREHLGVTSNQWADLYAALEQLEILLPDGTPRPKEEAPLLRSLRGESIGNEEDLVRNLATGEYRWRESSSAPIRNPEGDLMGAVATVRDITQRKQAEEALRQSRHDLERAQAIAHIGSWHLDVRRDELLWSDETYRIFGIPKGTPLTYETFLATVYPDDRDFVDSKWQAALHGEPYDIEHRICAEGAVKWIRETAELEFDDQGQLIGGFGAAQDVTDRKLAMEALERERRRIAAMESVAEAAIAAGSFEEVLSTLAIRIREGMNSHSSTLFLLDEEKNELEAVAACNIPEVVGFRITVGEGFAGKILQERRTMYMRDAENEPLVTDPHIKRANIRSLLGTPLIGRSGAVGVVYVNMEVIHEFSTEDRLLLEDLASRTALVIENARLVEEVSHNYALLQRALLPVKPPEFPGYLVSSAYLPAPRAEVGGDFYDFFMTESGKIAVLIGDVSGKGVPSASLAAAARSTVRAFAYDISSPDQALAHANAVLKSAKDDPTLFVTLLLMTLDSRGRICYASAGHPPSAIYRVQTGEVHFLTESGMLMGVVEAHDYGESETHLEVGDKLVLYTDGLSEARHDSELFGNEGIGRVLKEYGKRSPEEVVEALVRESSDWAGGRRTDDMAIIVIERTE